MTSPEKTLMGWVDTHDGVSLEGTTPAMVVSVLESAGYIRRFPTDYTIAELQARSHQQSKDKGFHDYQPTSLREVASLNAERVALFHSEASEMLEEQRKGHAPDYTYYSKTTKEFDYSTTRLVKETIEYFEEQQYWDDGTPYLKPEGQASEAADMVIRVMDWAGANGVDLQSAIIEKLDYNATRAKMHGGKAF